MSRSGQSGHRHKVVEGLLAAWWIMYIVAAVTNILLAVMLSLAGITKLIARQHLGAVLERLAVPVSAREVFGPLISVVELTLSSLLVVTTLSNRLIPPVDLACGLLFLCYSTAIVYLLSQNADVRCNCFGFGSSMITLATLWRSLLASSVSFFLALPGLNHTGFDVCCTLAVLLVGAVIAQCSFALWRKVKTRSSVIKQAILIDESTGCRVKLGDLLNRRDDIGLLFTSQACASCESLMSEIGDVKSCVLNVHLALNDDNDPRSSDISRWKVQSRRLLDQFGVRATPALVVLKPSGKALPPIYSHQSISEIVSLTSDFDEAAHVV